MLRHEVGHVLGYDHDKKEVMTPALGAGRVIDLPAPDRAEQRDLWPREPDGVHGGGGGLVGLAPAEEPHRRGRQHAAGGRPGGQSGPGRTSSRPGESSTGTSAARTRRLPLTTATPGRRDRTSA